MKCQLLLILVFISSYTGVIVKLTSKSSGKIEMLSKEREAYANHTLQETGRHSPAIQKAFQKPYFADLIAIRA